ncbi:unnamed protein product [Amoebophrya sp. A120]|nr:unnamed protein product [Amoebophrya sp. A120]|eukprot:GSA120T00015728001.1
MNNATGDQNGACAGGYYAQPNASYWNGCGNQYGNMKGSTVPGGMMTGNNMQYNHQWVNNSNAYYGNENQNHKGRSGCGSTYGNNCNPNYSGNSGTGASKGAANMSGMTNNNNQHQWNNNNSNGPSTGTANHNSLSARKRSNDNKQKAASIAGSNPNSPDISIQRQNQQGTTMGLCGVRTPPHKRSNSASNHSQTMSNSEKMRRSKTNSGSGGNHGTSNGGGSYNHGMNNSRGNLAANASSNASSVNIKTPDQKNHDGNRKSSSKITSNNSSMTKRERIFNSPPGLSVSNNSPPANCNVYPTYEHQDCPTSCQKDDDTQAYTSSSSCAVSSSSAEESEECSDSGVEVLGEEEHHSQEVGNLQGGQHQMGGSAAIAHQQQAGAAMDHTTYGHHQQGTAMLAQPPAQEQWIPTYYNPVSGEIMVAAAPPGAAAAAQMGTAACHAMEQQQQQEQQHEIVPPPPPPPADGQEDAGIGNSNSKTRTCDAGGNASNVNGNNQIQIDNHMLNLSALTSSPGDSFTTDPTLQQHQELVGNDPDKLQAEQEYALAADQFWAGQSWLNACGFGLPSINGAMMPMPGMLAGANSQTAAAAAAAAALNLQNMFMQMQSNCNAAFGGGNANGNGTTTSGGTSTTGFADPALVFQQAQLLSQMQAMNNGQPVNIAAAMGNAGTTTAAAHDGSGQQQQQQGGSTTDPRGFMDWLMSNAATTGNNNSVGQQNQNGNNPMQFSNAMQMAFLQHMQQMNMFGTSGVSTQPGSMQMPMTSSYDGATPMTMNGMNMQSAMNMNIQNAMNMWLMQQQMGTSATTSMTNSGAGTTATTMSAGAAPWNPSTNGTEEVVMQHQEHGGGSGTSQHHYGSCTESQCGGTMSKTSSSATTNSSVGGGKNGGAAGNNNKRSSSKDSGNGHGKQNGANQHHLGKSYTHQGTMSKYNNGNSMSKGGYGNKSSDSISSTSTAQQFSKTASCSTNVGGYTSSHVAQGQTGAGKYEVFSHQTEHTTSGTMNGKSGNNSRPLSPEDEALIGGGGHSSSVAGGKKHAKSQEITPPLSKITPITETSHHVLPSPAAGDLSPSVLINNTSGVLKKDNSLLLSPWLESPDCNENQGEVEEFEKMRGGSRDGGNNAAAADKNNREQEDNTFDLSVTQNSSSNKDEKEDLSDIRSNLVSPPLNCGEMNNKIENNNNPSMTNSGKKTSTLMENNQQQTGNKQFLTPISMYPECLRIWRSLIYHLRDHLDDHDVIKKLFDQYTEFYDVKELMQMGKSEVCHAQQQQQLSEPQLLLQNGCNPKNSKHSTFTQKEYQQKYLQLTPTQKECSQNLDFLLQICAEFRQLKLAEYFYDKMSDLMPNLMYTMMQVYASCSMYSPACELFFERHPEYLPSPRKNQHAAFQHLQTGNTANANSDNANKQNTPSTSQLGCVLKCCVELGQYDVAEKLFSSLVCSATDTSVSGGCTSNGGLSGGETSTEQEITTGATSLQSSLSSPGEIETSAGSSPQVDGGANAMVNEEGTAPAGACCPNNDDDRLDKSVTLPSPMVMNTNPGRQVSLTETPGSSSACNTSSGTTNVENSTTMSKQLDLKDYITMIRGFGRQGKLQEAKSIVKLLRENNAAACHANKEDTSEQGKENQNAEEITKANAYAATTTGNNNSNKDTSSNHYTLIRPAYNALLDTIVSLNQQFCNKDKKRELAKEILEEMEQFNLCDSVSYNTYLKAFCHTLPDAFDCLEQLRQKSQFTPDRVSYNSILNLAVSMGDSRRAWRIINEGLCGIKYPIDHYTVTIMLKTVRVQSTNHVNVNIAKNNKAAFKLLDKIWIGQDEFLLKTAIDSCIRGKEYQRLKRILECNEIKFPNVPTYGSLLKGWGILKNLENVKKLWAEMVTTCGLQPDEITLGCMIDACVSNNQVNYALELFNSYKTILKPNPIMYSTLLKGFALERRAKEALGFVRENNVLMNEVSYNTLIDACCRSEENMMQNAEELIEEMLSKNLKLDIITFGTLIKGYMMHGLVDHGIQIYRKHFCNEETRMLKPNEVIFNTLLDGCVKNNKCEQALELFNEMIYNQNYAGQEINGDANKNGNNTTTSKPTCCFTPSHFTLTIAIKMYGRLQKVDEALKLVEQWPVLYNISLNNHVFTCLLSALLNNKWFQHALQIPELMKKSDVAPDARTYGTLALGLLRNGGSGTNNNSSTNNNCGNNQMNKSADEQNNQQNNNTDWVLKARSVVLQAFQDGPGVEFDTLFRMCKQDEYLYNEVVKSCWPQCAEAKAVVDRVGHALYRGGNLHGNNGHNHHGTNNQHHQKRNGGGGNNAQNNSSQSGGMNRQQQQGVMQQGNSNSGSGDSNKNGTTANQQQNRGTTGGNMHQNNGAGMNNYSKNANWNNGNMQQQGNATYYSNQQYNQMNGNGSCSQGNGSYPGAPAAHQYNGSMMNGGYGGCSGHQGSYNNSANYWGGAPGSYATGGCNWGPQHHQNGSASWGQQHGMNQMQAGSMMMNTAVYGNNNTHASAYNQSQQMSTTGNMNGGGNMTSNNNWRGGAGAQRNNNAGGTSSAKGGR